MTTSNATHWVCDACGATKDGDLHYTPPEWGRVWLVQPPKGAPTECGQSLGDVCASCCSKLRFKFFAIPASSPASPETGP